MHEKNHLGSSWHFDLSYKWRDLKSLMINPQLYGSKIYGSDTLLHMFLTACLTEKAKFLMIALQNYTYPDFNFYLSGKGQMRR